MDGKLFGKFNVLYNDELDKLPVDVEIQKKVSYGTLDSVVSIVRRDYNELTSQVSIKPNNSMYGKVEVIAPPYRIHDLEPLKDSLVREYAPHINYGKSSSLATGKSDEGEYYSYLGFSLSDIPRLKELEEAKLTLYNVGGVDSSFELSLYRTLNDWTEETVKWRYKPPVGSLISSVRVNNDSKSLEVDILDYIKELYEEIYGGGSNDFSIIIKANSPDTVYWGSRESFKPPTLRVGYYDVPPNAGYSNLDVDVQLKVHGSQELGAEVDLVSDLVVSDLESTVNFEAKGLSTSIDADVMIGINEHSEIKGDVEFIPKYGSSSVDSDILLVLREYSFLDTSLEMESKSLYSSMESEVVIKAYGTSLLNSELEIPKKEINSDLDSTVTLSVPSFEELDSELEIPKKEINSDLDSDLVLSVNGFRELDSELEIPKKEVNSDLDSDLVLAVHDFRELYSELEITRKEVNSDLDSDVTLRSYGDSSIPVDVIFESKLDSSDVDVALFLRSYGSNDVDTDVEFKPKYGDSNIDSEANLRKKRGATNLQADTTIRAFWAEELEVDIYITRNFEIDAEVSMERKDASTQIDAEVFIDSGGDYAFIM